MVPASRPTAGSGRRHTTAKIQLYLYDPEAVSPDFRRAGEPVGAPSGRRPYRIAFSPDGNRLAVGYTDVPAVDVLDGTTLARVDGQSPSDATSSVDGLSKIAWSRDGRALFAAGAVHDSRNRRLLFAWDWDGGGLGDGRRMTYCAQSSATNIDPLPDGRVLMAALRACLGLMDTWGHPIWTVPSPTSISGSKRTS